MLLKKCATLISVTGENPKVVCVCVCGSLACDCVRHGMGDYLVEDSMSEKRNSRCVATSSY